MRRQCLSAQFSDRTACRSSAAAAVRSPHNHNAVRQRCTQQRLRAAEEARQVELDLAVQMTSPQGSQLSYILSTGESTDQVLYEPALRTYLTELQQERDAEAAMEAAAAEEAAAARAAAAAASSSSDSSDASYDISDTWDDDELMRRIRAVREAERGQVISDILYLECARRLQSAGYQLLNNLAHLQPGSSQPPADFVSAKSLARSQLLSAALIDAIVSFMASTFGGGDAPLMSVASPPQTPLSVDRVQAARLYAGLLEFGYFAAALEAECLKTGIQIGGDSSEMIEYADKLPEDKLKLLCSVRSADGWFGAVRHIGTVFGLKPTEDPFNSFGLQYPDLAVTISQIMMEPAANMWEHFSAPGSSVKLAAKAADKAARGWSGDGPDTSSLPDADLVSFEFGLFQRLLLEAAVYGSVLFGVEQHIEQHYGYKLSSRRDREEHASRPSL